MKREYLLKKIKEDVIGLDNSPLYSERIKSGGFPVIGEGSHFAKIMFIGEAPGANESKTGRPFCGSAGKILDECFDFIKLKRESVYITNIVKDRPPKNRDPLPEEISAYAPFLKKQIEIIQPEIIATLGRFSTQHILKEFQREDLIGPITKIHGKIFNVKASYGQIKIIPLLHPAVAVYGKSKKEMLFRGFESLRKFA